MANLISQQMGYLGLYKMVDTKALSGKSISAPQDLGLYQHLPHPTKSVDDSCIATNTHEKKDNIKWDSI
jgi:hypothetical protein